MLKEVPSLRDLAPEVLCCWLLLLLLLPHHTTVWGTRVQELRKWKESMGNFHHSSVRFPRLSTQLEDFGWSYHCLHQSGSGFPAAVISGWAIHKENIANAPPVNWYFEFQWFPLICQLILTFQSSQIAAYAFCSGYIIGVQWDRNIGICLLHLPWTLIRKLLFTPTI